MEVLDSPRGHTHTFFERTGGWGRGELGEAQIKAVGAGLSQHGRQGGQNLTQSRSLVGEMAAEKARAMTRLSSPAGFGCETMAEGDQNRRRLEQD